VDTECSGVDRFIDLGYVSMLSRTALEVTRLGEEGVGESSEIFRTRREILLSTSGVSVRVSPIGSGECVDEGGKSGLGGEETSARLS
jgi:hypothetical protein